MGDKTYGSVTISTVASSASSVTLIAARSARKKMIITNASTAILYVSLGTATATATTGHSFQIPSLGTFVLDDYTGAATAIWASANGSAQVTEIY